MSLEREKLEGKVNAILDGFVAGLKRVYQEDLISVILYGSLASGEFVQKHSNINLLVLLRDAGIANLKKASSLTGSFHYRMVHPLFFTAQQINNSLDVFPIEFLDIRENYMVIYGQDVLKDLTIDTRNLRFQCEHELKAKLINLKSAYLKNANSGFRLKLLFRNFTSVAHILRNLVRLKGRQPAYLKEEALKQVGEEFSLDMGNFLQILALKQKKTRLSDQAIEKIFGAFIADLEKLAELVDKI